MLGLPRQAVPHLGRLARGGRGRAAAGGRGLERFRTLWLLSGLPGRSGGLGLSRGPGRAGCGAKKSRKSLAEERKGVSGRVRANDPPGAAGRRPGASPGGHSGPSAHALPPAQARPGSAPLNWVTAGRRHPQAGAAEHPGGLPGQPALPSPAQAPILQPGQPTGWFPLHVKCKVAHFPEAGPALGRLGVQGGVQGRAWQARSPGQAGGGR